jgi:hypothetical protein
MQTEQQIQSAAAPAIAPQVDSDDSKPKRGGKRPGAGRKPNLAKRLLKGFTRDTIARAVEDIDVGTIIVGLLKAKSERTRLERLAFLRDTLHGRPAQNVSLSGRVNVNMAVWRPLESLTDEEMRLLDSITKKLSPGDVVDVVQDGPHNQMESKPAIETVPVGSEAIDVPPR